MGKNYGTVPKTMGLIYYRKNYVTYPKQLEFLNYCSIELSFSMNKIVLIYQNYGTIPTTIELWFKMEKTTAVWKNYRTTEKLWNYRKL